MSQLQRTSGSHLKEARLATTCHACLLMPHHFQYLIRFLTMTAEEFKAGQAATKLLTEEEEINILFSLLHIGAVLPKDLQEYKRVMQTLRRGRRGWRSGVWIRRRQKAERKENENVCSNARKKLGFIEEIFVLFACLFD